MTLRILRRSSFVATPWKNGGGITHEAIRVPATGDKFLWRVSVAEIESSGAFSDFTGYRRTMVLLRGSGVHLNFSDGSRSDLRAVGDVARFDGALAARCELVDGPCTDLNLMVSNALAQPRIRIERLRSDVKVQESATVSSLIFCIQGDVALNGTEVATSVLHPWDLAIADAAEALRITPADSSPGPMVFIAAISG
jgi:environmental stress-induced protein Ves